MGVGLVGLKGYVEYRWRDPRAKQTFDELGINVSRIWKEAAVGARGRSVDRIDLIRQEAHRLASPLIRQAVKLRAMYAKPSGETGVGTSSTW